MFAFYSQDEPSCVLSHNVTKIVFVLPQPLLNHESESELLKALKIVFFASRNEALFSHE